MKSTFNLEKLYIAKKIKKLKLSKKQDSSIARKESELECFKRVKVTDIPLEFGVNPEELKKKLTNPSSTEIERVFARILLNKQVQDTIVGLKDSYGVEFVENFLKANGKNIQSNKSQKLSKSLTKKKKDKKESQHAENDQDDDLQSEKSTSDAEGEPVTVTKSSLGLRKQEILFKAKITSSPARKKERSSTEAHLKNARKSVDSFFVNHSGENYHASVQAVDSESDGETPKKPAAKEFKKKPSTLKAFTNKPSEVVPKFESSMKHNSIKTEPSADLHPSWKAKAEMRKSQIQAFSGTKIKFDD